MLIEFKKTKNAHKDAHENAADMIDWLRKLADKKGESVGKKRIGDIEAEGFRVEEEGFPRIVWANPKTKMPVLIETSYRIGNQEVFGPLAIFNSTRNSTILSSA